MGRSIFRVSNITDIVFDNDFNREHYRKHKRNQLIKSKVEFIGSEEIDVLCPIDKISVFMASDNIVTKLDNKKNDVLYASVFVNTSSSASVVLLKRRGYFHALNVATVTTDGSNTVLGKLASEKFHQLSADLFGNDKTFASVRIILSREPLLIANLGDCIQIINSAFQTVGFRVNEQKVCKSTLKHRFNINDKDFVLMRTYANSREDDEQSNNHTCICCMNNSADILLMPCRHQSICEQCAKVYAQKLDCCPLCKIPIRVMLVVSKDQ